jgi:signal recognition particle GTPase
MAFRRNSTQPEKDIGDEVGGADESAAALANPSLARPPEPVVEWAKDDDALLAEMLNSHGFGETLICRLVELATAPAHTKRAVDRLAIALGAQFNFFALEEAWQKPILLCGLPGAGTSTLAAKLAARFDDSEVLVISAGAHDPAKIAELAECLEALDLPLTHAPDVATLGRAVAGAAGRKIIIDMGGQSPLDRRRVEEFAKTADAAGMLVMSGETASTEAFAVAQAASAIGIGRVIVTHIDVARYLGAVLTAADATKLALVSGSVTPHFGFGLRALTPENLARRLMAALHAERWRVSPL